MDSGLGESRKGTSPRAAEPQLRLLIELPSRRKVFLQNLRDRLFRRDVVRVWTTSPPGKFWPDVFVPTGFPWARMAESGVLHVLSIAMLITFTHLYLSLAQHTVRLRPHTAITDFEISEYLPPIDTGAPPAPKPRRGEPLLAKQKIVSLPPRPDNFEQTIITPVDVKLPSNVPLPNIVAWTPVPAPPAASALRNTAQLTLPQLPTNAIAPPPERVNLTPKVPQLATRVIGPVPDARNLAPDRHLDLAAKVIGPPPSDDAAKLRTPRDIIAVAPAVIGPPPEANVSRNLGAMNVGKLSPTVGAPKLELAEQRTLPLPPVKGPAAPAPGGGSQASAANAAPSAPAQGALANGPAAGQLIALNLHPMNVAGQLNVPPGRRAGEFAAAPEGKPNAPGTPDIHAGGNGSGGTGKANSGAGNGNDLPSGIVIGNAPGAPPAGSVVVAGPPPNPSTNDKPFLLASSRPPRIGDLPPNLPAQSLPTAPSRIEDKIFGGKTIYSMALNMPNLTSSGGSWIIHFAQLENDRSVGRLTAPVATTKVDPAYPAELMRDGVEGTVILYAVIHKDGTVGDVRVLRGLQGRLDENARLALLRWKFRPGTKNGQAIDLEAVVQIPYKAPRFSY